MTNREELLRLAERCEAATGPDREIDGAIDRLFNKRPKHGDYDPGERAVWRVKDGWSGLLVRGDGFARGSFCAAEYTASLDAAMTLVPEGWEYVLMERTVWSSGNSLALALTAAALRALAQTGDVG